MKQPQHHVRDDESGIALFYALLVTLIVGGIVTVVVATSITETRQSAFELNYEDTVHVAEAGAEVFLQRLVEDGRLTSGIDGPADGQTAEDWALEKALERDTSTGDFIFAPIEMGEGEAVAIRPSGNDAEFVYGVGFTPNREAYEASLTSGADTAYARVVRVQVAFSDPVISGDFALLAGGNLKLNGNYKILSDQPGGGAVHTNGQIDVTDKGESGTVDGGITYTGGCKAKQNQPCPSNVAGPVPAQPIPSIRIEETWQEASSVAVRGEFWEYCEDGLWYRRAGDAEAPCERQPGTQQKPAAFPSGGTAYLPVAGDSAVYYFDGVTPLDIDNPEGDVTFLTRGEVDLGPSSSRTDAAIDLNCRFGDLLVATEASVKIQGNWAAETDDACTVFANHEIKFNGTPTSVNIAYIARDGLDAGTTIDGGGGGFIRYDGGATPEIGGPGAPIIVRWDEVR